MSGLTDFLLARIAEDEAVARAVKPLGHNFDMGGNRQDERFTHGRMGFASEDGYPRTLPEAGERAHFARWDPTRVLAECEAKRRIVELHKDWPVLIQTEPALEVTPETWVAKMTSEIAWRTNAEYVKRFGADPPTAPILLALAQPYADHPDFRGEWRV